MKVTQKFSLPDLYRSSVTNLHIFTLLLAHTHPLAANPGSVPVIGHN